MFIRLNMVKCVFMNWDLGSRSINMMIEFVALFITFYYPTVYIRSNCVFFAMS